MTPSVKMITIEIAQNVIRDPVNRVGRGPVGEGSRGGSNGLLAGCSEFIEDIFIIPEKYANRRSDPSKSCHSRTFFRQSTGGIRLRVPPKAAYEYEGQDHVPFGAKRRERLRESRSLSEDNLMGRWELQYELWEIELF